MAKFNYLWIDDDLMGEFVLTCDCGNKIEDDEQDKILAKVNHSTFKCNKCGKRWAVKRKIWVEELK